ncbi:uncharacterized protein Z520_06151 [Fonsecaea multimorphosa CBS 102226]|uniref:Zn(2)-C6 fungal-type domain-containing protein n=1 Tax=Fonsecaea multimorphosa CBS 102226 TaxID=1442371 RepID=A0A0D2IM31_9EURO|nr:uncharacterized protein Z520_06151 [Fonsecaea multimorphosa CBS 102226]KIX98071.1 hypothetical protein Z520_06151 [Fonsecaea multimorphosa CBS 102226]OAL24155.1 hypothetical protein AYO22_05814 [Fonsecaea multimorphosa]
MPGLIQSGNSSPNVRDMLTEGPPPSPADKKRNKLGYHRTAVACVHCRRRKIRCMPDFHDPVGRCQNCIRLKKECVFLPIDPQNPPTAKRPRSGAKAADGIVNEGEASVSSSSPGGILRSSSMEQINYARGSLDTPPMSSESPGFQGFHPGSRSVSVHGFDFAHGYDPAQQHRQQQQVFIPSPYSPRNFDGDSINPQFYQQQHAYGQSIPTPYSSPYAPGSLPSTMTTMSQEHGYPYQTSAPNGGYGWANPPTRSMSSDQTDELSSGFPTPYRTNTYPSFERGLTGQMQQLPPTSSSLAPMGIDSQHTSTHPNFPEHTSYQTAQANMQQGWTAGNHATMRRAPGSVDSSYSQGWYQPHPGLTSMQQEEEQPHILPSQNHNPRKSQHKPG